MNIFSIGLGGALIGAGTLMTRSGHKASLIGRSVFEGVHGTEDLKRYINEFHMPFHENALQFVKNNYKTLTTAYRMYSKKQPVFRRMVNWFAASEFTPKTWNRIAGSPEFKSTCRGARARFISKNLSNVEKGVLNRIRAKAIVSRLGATTMAVMGTGLALGGLFGGGRHFHRRTVPYSWG